MSSKLSSIEIESHLESYFASSQLKEDIEEAFKKYYLGLCSDYILRNEDEFINEIGSLSNWLTNTFFIILKENSIGDSGFSELFFDWFLKNYSSKIKLPYGKRGRIRIHQKKKALKIIESLSMSKIVKDIPVSRLMQTYLLDRQKEIFNEIKQGDFLRQEIINISRLKRMDIYRNIYLVEIKHIRFDSHGKKQYYAMLTSKLMDLRKGKIHVWNNLFSTISDQNIYPPHKFKIPSYSCMKYNFQEYRHIPFVIYCRDIANEDLSIEIVKDILSRPKGDQLPEDQKEFLKDYERKHPNRFNAIYSQVYDDQLFKYVKYTALTSLFSLLDPLLKNICIELNTRGLNIAIHKYNISVTYDRFKSEYTNATNTKAVFPHFQDFINVFDQIFSREKGNLRNAISHLDGIDFTLPSSHFKSLFLFTKSAYSILAEFAAHENLKLTIEMLSNKISASDYVTIQNHEDGFNDYVKNGLINSNALSFIHERLFNGNQEHFAFFLSDNPNHNIDFIIENWGMIYPGQEHIDVDVLQFILPLKKEIQRLFVKSTIHTRTYSDQEVIDGLQQITCENILRIVRQALDFNLTKITTNLFEMCPSYSHLIKISLKSVRVSNGSEAFLTITASAILIEKILLCIKQYLQLPHCISVKRIVHDKSEYYSIFYKNMEIANPTDSSFSDNAFLSKSYSLITGGKDSTAPDFKVYKNLLITVENIRNVAAHGGSVNFSSDYAKITEFLFFVTFRIIHKRG